MTDEEREAWFDAEIAPALMALANRCLENGMAMVSTVEYAPDKRSSTYAMPSGAGLAMHMLRMCSAAGRNIDGYIIGLAKYCHANNIDTGASFVMRRFGMEPEQAR
jgi:hypothetical protein